MNQELALSALRHLNRLDRFLGVIQSALTVIASAPASSRPDPGDAARRADSLNTQDQLSTAERADVIGLMRVNHVGEICAQALYEAQAWWARDPDQRALLQKASREEGDHLAWTHRRVTELGGRVSYMVPLWYGGAFAIGSFAALLGDRVSLGFMAETENQVERHLMSHLDRLPSGDAVSRAIVEQMKIDEVGHAQTALQNGGIPMPQPVQWAMKAAAKVMTTAAYRF